MVSTSNKAYKFFMEGYIHEFEGIFMSLLCVTVCKVTLYCKLMQMHPFFYVILPVKFCSVCMHDVLDHHWKRPSRWFYCT
jgi:hypothetical protein